MRKPQKIVVCRLPSVIRYPSSAIRHLPSVIHIRQLPKMSDNFHLLTQHLVGFGRLWSVLVGFGRFWSASVGSLVGFRSAFDAFGRFRSQQICRKTALLPQVGRPTAAKPHNCRIFVPLQAHFPRSTQAQERRMPHPAPPSL